MPIYEYRCRRCGEVFSHRFRTLKAAEAGDMPSCPACDALDVQRLISSVAVLGGGPGGGDEGGAEAAESETKTFGRKELHKALKERGY